MNKLTSLLLFLLLLPAVIAWGEESRGGSNGAPERSSTSGRENVQGRSASEVSRQPVVINMNRGTSGGYNQNFPAYQPPSQPSDDFQPTYGRLNWNSQTTDTSSDQRGESFQTFENTYQGSLGQNSAPAGYRTAVAFHHHPYTPGYVRKRLQRIGVTSEPSIITNRSEIMNTNRNHSIIRFPSRGPRQLPITAKVITPRQFSSSLVRHQMTLLDSLHWRSELNRLDVQETHRNHYYWHTQTGFDFCHYVDRLGYQWYGWYEGNQFFWTRYFDGRWWWYDPDYNRWCFWNNGFWWWQDPYHVADLYCYDNENYIPCNSADDQVVVTAPSGVSMQSYVSPDGTRMVKVASDTGDAFLYDASNPPRFSPVYLASGVQSVQFSDTTDGRSLEIILKLSDGSFDMFDGEGNPYNSVHSNGGESAPGAGGPLNPPPAGGPPNNPGSVN